MTAKEIYDYVVGVISTPFGYPIQISPNQFMRILQSKMTELHEIVSIYHWRCKITVTKGNRYQGWPPSLPELLGILRLSYNEKPLKEILPMQYPGVHNITSSMRQGIPTSYWIERNIAIAPLVPIDFCKTLIGLDPIPDSDYTLRCIAKLALPKYDNWNEELPVTIDSHNAIKLMVLLEFLGSGIAPKESYIKQNAIVELQKEIRRLHEREQVIQTLPNIRGASYYQIGY